MPQTLQAVGALLLVSILVFSTLQSRNQSQRERVQGVVEAESRTLVSELLERLESTPFDSAVPTPSDPAPLTRASAFGPQGTVSTGQNLDSLRSSGVISDLDDFDGIRGVLVERWLTEPVAGVPQPLVFEVDVDVEYVSSTSSGWVPSLTATRQKRATITTRSSHGDDPARLARIYSDFR